MRILYCIPELYNAGGMERIISAKVNWLASLGHELIVVTTDGKGNKPYFPLHSSVKIIDLGLNYIDDRGLNPLRWRWNRIRKLSRHKRLLARVLRDIRPDVSVSTFEQEAHILYKLPFAGRRILEYHFVRNLRSLEPRTGIRRYVDKYLDFKDGRVTGKYDAFVVLTDKDRKAWPCQTNIHVIPNFILSNPDKHSDLTRKKVIAAGRLERVKGYSRLIEAWNIVSKKFPDWKLEIYGKGTLKDELQSLIRNKKLEKCVCLKDPVPDIYEPMSESSVYAMTSIYEGFSMVIIEAFAMGLPVVAFNVDCGPSSLVTHGKNGLLADDGDIEAFVSRLSDVMASYKLRTELSAGALESASHFRRDAVMEKWLNIFGADADRVDTTVNSRS